MRADAGLAPILDATFSAGRVVDDEVVTSITMLPPNLAVAPFTKRSGDTAPLKMYRLLLVNLPVWRVLEVAGLISYQRTSAPAPPMTVCWVHRPSAVRWPGSIA